MRRALALLAVLVVSHWTLFAQAPAPVKAGQSVRVTSIRHEIKAEVGTVLAATADTIVVQLKGVRTVDYRQVFRTDTVALAINAIDRLEVSRHTGHATGRGALIGLGVGAAAGLVIGMLTYEPCPPDAWLCWAPSSSAEAGIEGAAALGLIGAGAGALIGTTIRADRWEPLVLSRDGISLGLRLTF